MVVQGLEFLDLSQQRFILFLVSGFNFFHQALDLHFGLEELLLQSLYVL